MLTLMPRSVAANPSRNGFGGPKAEQYYSLVHWLRAIGDMSGVAPKSIGVTGCAGGAGVTTVASHLAAAAADVFDRPVLLLDLSAGRLSLARRFNMSGDLGLPGALADVSHAGCYAKPTPVANLWLLAAGEPCELSMSNIDFNAIHDLVRSLENDFSFVILDLPTVDSSLCFVAAGSLNGVLLVLEAERTRSETAVRAKQRLIDARASVLGVILNKDPQHMPGWLEERL